MGVFSSIGGAFKEGWNSARETQNANKKLQEDHLNRNPYSSYYKENIGKITFTNEINSTELQQVGNYNQKDNFIYENPFKLSEEVLNTATKNYHFVYKNPAYITGEYGITGQDENQNDIVDGIIFKLPVVPSLFNPLYGIDIIGMDGNTPILNGDTRHNYKGKQYGANDYDTDLSDCSIKTLVKLSDEGKLGRGIFKYSDFMYCKNLGKYSNNRLLTLRRFPIPIGDDIWSIDQKEIGGPDISGDIGRLVTWMDDTNKLEDILKYNYKDSFVERKGKFIDNDTTSREDNEFRGILGAAINLANPKYRSGIAKAWGNQNKLLGMVFDQNPPSSAELFGKALTGANTVGVGDNYTALYTRYDNNRIYEPKGTTRDTHLYEGELTFSQEFSLTFDYELRAYENINPRTAFLDLINNIQHVTYRKGNFWGGRVWWIGAPSNKKAWRTANAMIDNTWDKLTDTFTKLCSGELDIGNWFADAWSKIENIGTSAMNTLGEWLNDPQAFLKKLGDGATKLGVGNILKNMVKNKLGRPAIYATDSVLTGDPVGLWHLTIGNPRNPIMSIGNLIIDGSTIQQYGPLGLDDFPTGVKVTVNLKHGKARDMMEIGKMYTMGRVGLGVPLASSEYPSMISNLEINKDESGNNYTDDDGKPINMIMNSGGNNNYANILYTANQFATMWASTLPSANEGNKKLKTKTAEQKDQPK